MQTILTQFSTLGDATSAITTKGRGYVHAQFRAGSAISNVSVVLSTMSMIIALQAKLLGGETNMWADIQTWTILVTESLPGRDLSYFVAEPGLDVRLAVKSLGSGICQARVWEG